MGLLKNVLLVIGIVILLVAFRMCQVSGGDHDTPRGFVAVPRPSNAPANKVLLVGPKDCPKEVGRRIDSLERSIHAAGIPCVRLSTVSISPSSSAEAGRVDKVMNGDLPVVFVGNYAKNNPTLEEIKTQLRNGGK